MITQPHEKKYVLSPENLKVNGQIAEALLADDMDKVDELLTKWILPLKSLKNLGREFVIRNGLPTVTAEIANDTDWLE